MIYASRISNLTDARYFAAREEVQYLGFNLEEGTNGYLDPVYMQAMREWVQGPQIVGEYRSGDTSAAVIREAATFFQLDAILVHKNTDFDTLSGLNFGVILPISQTNIENFCKHQSDKAAFFVLQLNQDWQAYNTLAIRLCQQYKIIISADLTQDDFTRIQHDWQPAGFLFSGGEEEQVGIKSFEELDEILESLI